MNMTFFKKDRNILDERQEQTLLKIEHNGCWMAFWGLLVIIVVQMFIYRDNYMSYVAGEWIMFMILALYLSIESIRNGIWDRRLKNDNRTYILSSLTGAGIAGFISAVLSYMNHKSVLGSLAVFVVMFIMIFVACLVAMIISGEAVKAKNKKMDEKYNDDEN